MLCNIELLIEGLELLDESRECDSDVSEIEIPIKEDIDNVKSFSLTCEIVDDETEEVLDENYEIKILKGE